MKFLDFKRQIKKFPVFPTSLLGTLTPKISTLKVQLSVWKKQKKIDSLRKGLYILSPEERQVEPSLFYLANQIYLPSYVSLESALAYYDLIPEFVATTTSITPRKTIRFQNEFGLFTYQHISPKAYGGFENKLDLNKLSVLVSLPEKAVADFFYLNLSYFNQEDTFIFEESYRLQNCSGLNVRSLRHFAAQFDSLKLRQVMENFIRAVVLKQKKRGKKNRERTDPKKAATRTKSGA